ncbi:M23 family metallopeptidase [Fulvivirga sp. RKSG066]|nr:M23 family metallopeptidase [Fulvivirga aurantia]
MKLNKLYFCLLFIIFTTGNTVFAQLEESLKTDEPYYLFPIKPGERNSLAGTMGELRSSHFHTGLDIRTEGRIGLPVQSSADGYISRVAVSTSGYGNALYVTHPNGHTTVYAHLDKFNGPIAEYVKKEQYRRKTSALNLYFHKNRFEVNKGDVIAYSGNSGSSGGPHLHYDIRDQNNNVLNPLKYGFGEILDNTPPVAQKLAIKTLDKYARVDGQFGRKEYDLRRVGNDYTIDKPIAAYGKVGLEIYAYDKLDNSRFRCGITNIEVLVDGESIFEQNIDMLYFSKQRNILVHMDYPELRETGQRYHKLYVDDGNELHFYSAQNEGKLNLGTDCKKQVKVKMTDSYRNVSYLDFEINCKLPDHTVTGTNINKNTPTLLENTLVISVTANSSENALDLYLPEKNTIPASYVVGNEAVYLWDMKEGLPYSVSTDKGESVLNYQTMVVPETAYNFYSKHIDIDFPSKALFDTLYMQSRYEYDSATNRELFEIGNERVPLKRNIGISLKPEKAYSEKYAVYAMDSYNNLYYEGGVWKDGRITFYSRNFGKYTIAADTVPPKIIPVKTNSQDLMFKITDELSGIKSYECTIDGNWVLMHYDHKRNLIWSEKLHDERFNGEVKLTLIDNSNNKTEYKIEL